jgi:hypothetical protein
LNRLKGWEKNIEARTDEIIAGKRWGIVRSEEDYDIGEWVKYIIIC